MTTAAAIVLTAGVVGSALLASGAPVAAAPHHRATVAPRRGDRSPAATRQPHARSKVRVSPLRYGVAVSKNLTVTMIDGVVLRVDEYFPINRKTGKPAKGPFPSLLTQTPYGKNDPVLGSLGGGADKNLVERGYIEVVEDVRGRGGSEGKFDFWGPKERRDSIRVARFAAKLPHSNGKVGLFGGSYMGQTQLLTEAVAGRHSPIKAAVPVVSIDNVGQDGYYGGIPNFGFGLIYAAIFPTTGLIGLLDYIGANNPLNEAKLTVSSVTSSLSLSGPLMADMALGGPAAHDGPYWHDRNIQTHLKAIAASHIPTLLVGGWYDIMGKGSAMTYVGLQDALHHRATYRPLPAHMKTSPRVQWLNGPWTHAGSLASPVTERATLMWFDHWLKGMHNGVARRGAPTAHLQVIGSNRYISSRAWPVKPATSKIYYLGGRGRSGALSLNDGILSGRRPTAKSGHDSVAWSGASSPCSVRVKIQTAGLLDTIPGSALVGKTCGPGSEYTTEAGGLTYTTAPFMHTKVVAGPIGMSLYASSNRPDAEFIVGVSTVGKAGHATSIQSGALLGSLRKVVKSRSWYNAHGQVVQPFHPFTASSSTPLTPGKITHFQIGVWPTAFEVKKGQRLRITVSTSDVPFAMPSVPTIPNLVGGVYQVQRDRHYASSVTIPMVSPKRLTRKRW
jgi:putative CocE/NonD family hydrolase